MSGERPEARPVDPPPSTETGARSTGPLPAPSSFAGDAVPTQDARRPSALPPLDLARARHLLYDLLGRLLLEGPAPELRDRAAALPALAGLGAPDVDALAAAHHAALGHSLSPHESAVLGPEGLLGGDVAGRVRAAYHEGRHEPRAGEPDHLGAELGFLATLSQVEAQAIEGGRDGIRDRARLLSARFLDEHLLRWAPLIAAALHGHHPWDAVVDLAVELAASHRDELPHPRGAWELPPEALDLDSPDTGLRAIATWLLRPARSGWICTSDVIGAAAAAAGVPGGFGGRTDRLVGSLFTAGDHGQLDRLASALAEAVDAQGSELRRRADELGLGPATSPWLARQHHTRALLERLSSTAAAHRKSRTEPI